MFKRRSGRCIWRMGVLCLIFPAIAPSQEAAKSAKKPGLIELQLKVADKKDGRPIDDADVKVMGDIFHRDGLRRLVRYNRALVNPPRQLIETNAMAAKAAFEGGQIEPSQVGDHMDVEVLQLLLRDLADPR
jgi:hypothetical protein